MIANTLFIKVVPQTGGRGYMLLGGFDTTVTHRTAAQYMSLSAPTREGLNKAIALIKSQQSASDIHDITAPNILKQLAKLFGEIPDAKPVAHVQIVTDDPSFAPAALHSLNDAEFMTKLKTLV